MIISHAHRFIFLKTKKTAGTSTEAMLSRFCGPDDVITPISEPDEVYRQGPGPQNWQRDGTTHVDGIEPHYFNHIKAELVRRYVGADIWNTYFKFAIERNPWDREVSNYFWKFRNNAEKPSFDEYVSNPAEIMKGNFDIYTIEGQLAVDYVCQYDSLEADLRTALKRVGIHDHFDLPRAKGGFRTDRRPWQEFYTPSTRDIIAKAHVHEIEIFGYTF